MPDGGPIPAEFQEAAIADARQQPLNAVAPFESRLPVDGIALTGTPFLEVIRQQHDEGLKDPLDNVIQRVGEDAVQFLGPHKHLIKGPPRNEVPGLAKSLQVDLVVMGTVARTGVPGFLIGNTAEAMPGQIDCPVLAVKPAGFVTPVTLD